MVNAMTRKDYYWFAQWCAESNISDHRMSELCDYFKENNAAFKRNVFLNVYRTHKENYNEYNRDLKKRLRA
jgi:hypothetical protein